MIYVDQHAPPHEIARTLWRELGPQACIALALSLAVRGDEHQAVIIDLSGLEESNEA
jgi:hypothetical protein